MQLRSSLAAVNSSSAPPTMNVSLPELAAPTPENEEEEKKKKVLSTTRLSTYSAPKIPDPLTSSTGTQCFRQLFQPSALGPNAASHEETSISHTLTQLSHQYHVRFYVYVETRSGFKWLWSSSVLLLISIQARETSKKASFSRLRLLMLGMHHDTIG